MRGTPVLEPLMNAQYEARQGYLYVKATGEFDPAGVRRIFHEWMAEARRANVMRGLCDLTSVSGLDDQLALTMIVYSFASFIAESLPKGFLLAVLETPKQFAEDRFGENVMRNKGANVKMTTSLEEALDWLDLPQPARIQALAHCSA